MFLSSGLTQPPLMKQVLQCPNRTPALDHESARSSLALRYYFRMRFFGRKDAVPNAPAQN